MGLFLVCFIWLLVLIVGLLGWVACYWFMFVDLVVWVVVRVYCGLVWCLKVGVCSVLVVYVNYVGVGLIVKRRMVGLIVWFWGL